MPRPIWDELEQFVDSDDFATIVTLQMQDGRERVFPAIYDDPYLNAQLGEYEVDTARPRLNCMEQHVVGVTRGDRVIIGDYTFDILSAPQADGTGFAMLQLAPSDFGQ